MNQKSKISMISLPEVVGKGYGEFWRFRGRYRVVKGSRSSKKSTTAALFFIFQMMKHEGANLLVVRKTFRTLKDSCFAQLKWAAKRLAASELWQFKTSPLEATYLPTGQKIFFRGLDDPLKITSIAAESGAICWLWIEEAYEVMSESDFDILDESIRGSLPPGLWQQITLTFNPWNERHWIKQRFYDRKDDNILALTTNYTCNEFLSPTDKKLFEDMKKRNPRRYQVAGLGHWGIVEGLVYENWKEERFELKDLPSDAVTTCGLDYGYTNDPSAFVVLFYSEAKKQLYVWDEFYKKQLSNKDIYQEISELGYEKEKIIGDSAEPKSNAELRSYGLRITGARKGPDSILNGVQWIQDLEIVIHPRCTNFLTEISNYGFAKDKFGKTINQPIDDFNHLMDAMRYALEPYHIGRAKSNYADKIQKLKRLGL